MKLSLHCTCGDSVTGTITPDAKAQRFIDVTWKSLHSGPGHEPCDAKTAARARKEIERQMNKATHYYGVRERRDGSCQAVVYHYDSSGDREIFDYQSGGYDNKEQAKDAAATYANENDINAALE